MTEMIAGVLITPLKRFTDARGWLCECFRRDELPPDLLPAMAYLSMTLPGIARGPHEHRDQTDFFVFVGPSDFRLYLWDQRKSSPTFGRSLKIDVGHNYPCAVAVPPGVIHAYKNIGAEPGLVFNAPNRLYRGEGKQAPVDEIRHEDIPDSRFSLD